MSMTPSILSNETATANQLASSSFSPGGVMAPTAVNNYNGSTAGQGQLLTQSNQNGGFSPNQIGNLAGKGLQQLVSPSNSFKSITDSLNEFGTNFGFSPGAGSVANAGDLLTAGISSQGTSATTGALSGLDFSFGGDTSLLSGANSSALSNSFGAALMSDSNAGALGADAFGSGATDALGITADSSSIFSSGATFSGVLGAAGIGALGGGLLASLTGGNPTGGSIGGGLGAGIGMAFGGPPGALIGGIGGSLIGGLFGGHSTPTQASEFAGYFGDDGGLTKVGYGSKNAGSYASFSSNLAGSFGNLTKNASQALGIKFDPNILVDGAYSSQHGGARISVGGKDFWYNEKDSNSTQQAQIQALQYAAQLSGYTNTDALNNYVKQVTTSGVASGLPQGTPNVTPQSGSFAATVAAQKQGQTQNASSTATPTV